MLAGGDIDLAIVAETIDKQMGEEYRIKTNYSLATANGLVNYEYALGGEARMIAERASIIALDIIRKHLLKTGGSGTESRPLRTADGDRQYFH
jgi:hypothetical protein